MGNFNYLFLMAPAPEGGSSFTPLIMIGMMFVIIYFFMIRPQVKRQKELTTYRNSLQKGDKVITTGGIYGKIADVKENVVTVDVGNEVRLRVDKSAILKDSSDIQPK
jgi:preprotein translocase subunit YajC